MSLIGQKVKVRNNEISFDGWVLDKVRVQDLSDHNNVDAYLIKNEINDIIYIIKPHHIIKKLS